MVMGEKSVMMITEYMKLKVKKNMRFVGIWGYTENPKRLYTNKDEAYSKRYPLALLMAEVDLEANILFDILICLYIFLRRGVMMGGSA